MDQELKGIILVSSLRKATPRNQRPITIDIKEIGAMGFYFNMLKKENEVFITSLCEIDRIIEEKEALEEDEETIEEIKKKLPAAFSDYIDVCSKAASDTLSPHRAYDHKIELETENNLGYSPLHRQSIEELKAAKQYIVENLGKGFIEGSQAPFASPILMVRKSNGGLRFCVDYRKLNAITRKDRYPLPLIDETLARLG